MSAAPPIEVADVRHRRRLVNVPERDRAHKAVFIMMLILIFTSPFTLILFPWMLLITIINGPRSKRFHIIFGIMTAIIILTSPIAIFLLPWMMIIVITYK